MSKMDRGLVLEPLKDVLDRVRMCKSRLYSEIASDRFPRPVKVGRGTAFVASEVDDWVRARKAEREESAARQAR